MVRSSVLSDAVADELEHEPRVEAGAGRDRARRRHYGARDPARRPRRHVADCGRRRHRQTSRTTLPRGHRAQHDRQGHPGVLGEPPHRALRRRGQVRKRQATWSRRARSSARRCSGVTTGSSSGSAARTSASFTTRATGDGGSPSGQNHRSVSSASRRPSVSSQFGDAGSSCATTTRMRPSSLMRVCVWLRVVTRVANSSASHHASEYRWKLQYRLCGMSAVDDERLVGREVEEAERVLRRRQPALHVVAAAEHVVGLLGARVEHVLVPVRERAVQVGRRLRRARRRGSPT